MTDYGPGHPTGFQPGLIVPPTALLDFPAEEFGGIPLKTGFSGQESRTEIAVSCLKYGRQCIGFGGLALISDTTASSGKLAQLALPDEVPILFCGVNAGSIESC